jgi:hypothetical protein
MVAATARHAAADAPPTAAVAKTITLIVCTEAEQGWHWVAKEYSCLS